MSPYQQGELDGLCGLYSVVNAIQLAAWPQVRISKNEYNELFRLLAVELNDSGLLLDALSNGAYARPLSRMLRTAMWWFNDRSKLQLRFRRPFYHFPRVRTATLIETVDRHLKRPGTSSIAGITGKYEHWTVIQSISEQSLRLFDSGGIHYVRHFRTRFRTKMRHPPISLKATDLYLIWIDSSRYSDLRPLATSR